MKGIRVLLLVAVLVLFGGVFTQAQEGNFVGHLEGTDAFVAIVSNGDEAVAFVCDGAEIVAWLRGAVEDGSLALESSSSTGQNTYLLEAQLGASAEGSLTLNGQPLSFTAEPAEDEAGLYRAGETLDGVTLIGGWIVNNSGEQRGAVIGGVSSRSASLDLKTLKSKLEDEDTLTAQRVTPEDVTPEDSTP